MEETKEVMLPKPLINEMVIQAVKQEIDIMNAAEDLFEPDGIVAIEDVDEVVKQNWIHCLPRPAEFCRIKISGNSLIITPVQITDIA